MLLTGLEQVRIGIMKSREDETIAKEDIYVLNGKTGGPTAFNIQNISADVEGVYGGDMLRRVTGKGNGQISATFNADDVPGEVLHAILGYEQNEKDKIWRVGKNTTAPYCAVEVLTHDANGQAIWLGLPKGQFSRGDVNPQTNTEKETDATDSLTYTALNRADGYAYVEALESDGVTQSDIDTELFGQAVDEDAGSTDPEETATPSGGTE